MKNTISPMVAAFFFALTGASMATNQQEDDASLAASSKGLVPINTPKTIAAGSLQGRVAFAFLSDGCHDNVKENKKLEKAINALSGVSYANLFVEHNQGMSEILQMTSDLSIREGMLRLFEDVSVKDYAQLIAGTKGLFAQIKNPPATKKKKYKNTVRPKIQQQTRSKQQHISKEYYIKSILQTLTSILPPMRANVATDAASIIDGFKERDVCDVLDAITMIPHNERQSVLKLMEPCLHPGINGHKFKTLTRMLLTIPCDERASVTEYTFSILRKMDHMSFFASVNGMPAELYEDGQVLSALAMTRPDKRACVAHYASELIKEGVNTSVMSGIIKGLSKVQTDDMRSVVDHTRLLQGKDENVHIIASNIEKVRMITEGRRLEILQYASPLIRGLQGDLNDAQYVIEALESLPRQDFACVVECVISLGLARGNDVVYALRELTKIPADSRQKVVMFAKQTKTHDQVSLEDLMRAIAAYKYGEEMSSTQAATSSASSHA